MQIARQLYREITSIGSWGVLRRVDTDAEYFVPGSGNNRGDVRWIKIINTGSTSVQVRYALSTSGSAPTIRHLSAPFSLAPGAMFMDSMMVTLPPGYGIAAMIVSGGSPVNVATSANVLEIT